MVLKLIYTIFISVLIALFVGVGISAFYPAPKSPEYPTSLSFAKPDAPASSTESAKMRAEQEKFNKQSKAFQDKTEIYNRNVSIISVITAVIILAGSLIVAQKILFMSDGLMLGGVFTLGYAIVRGFGSGDDKFRFIVVSIGLVLSLILGYVKFIRSQREA